MPEFPQLMHTAIDTTDGRGLAEVGGVAGLLERAHVVGDVLVLLGELVDPALRHGIGPRNGAYLTAPGNQPAVN